jgi:hypothetical protein
MYSNNNSNSNSNYIDDPESINNDVINTNETTQGVQQEQQEQQEQQVEERSTPYRRLTFIHMNQCDFCTNVQTPGPYMHYISFVTKNGWASCANERCKQRGKDEVANFMATKAFGRANHLKDRPIKIKRTSGQMDDDWVLEKTFPEVQLSSTGEEKVCVTKLGADLEKWVSVNNILSWNN